MKNHKTKPDNVLAGDSANTLNKIINDELVRAYFYAHCRRCSDAGIDDGEWLALFSIDDETPPQYVWDWPDQIEWSSQ